MAGFGIKTPWTSQPQFITSVTGDSIANGLTSLWSLKDGGTRFVDYKNKNNGTASTALATKTFTGQHGGAVGSVFSGSQYVNCGSDISMRPTEFTLLAVFTPSALSGTNVEVMSTHASQTGFTLGFDTSNRLQAIIGATSAWQFAYAGTGVVGKQYAAVFTHSAANTRFSIYANGVKGDSVAYGGVYQQTTQPLYVGASANYGNYFNGTIALAAVWGREMSHAEALSLSRNPWQIFQPIERRIWVPSAGGGTTISGNPIVWQWEANNVVSKEKVSTTPTDWQWFTTTGTSKEKISSVPVDWQWFVTSGSVQEGSATTITGNPIAWEWQSGTASFVQKIQGVPVNWEWQVTTGTSKEKIDVIPKAFEWQVTTGQIRGTDTIDTTPVAWTWEVTQGNVVYLQPQQTSGTIGGKKDKRVKLPYYEGKDYESRIDLEESVRDDSRSVSDFLDVRGDVLGDGARSDGKPVELVDREVLQSGVAIGDLLAEFKEEAKQVSVIELPQVEESEGFDEEAAVIMLLLAA